MKGISKRFYSCRTADLFIFLVNIINNFKCKFNFFMRAKSVWFLFGTLSNFFFLQPTKILYMSVQVAWVLEQRLWLLISILLWNCINNTITKVPNNKNSAVLIEKLHKIFLKWFKLKYFPLCNNSSAAAP